MVYCLISQWDNTKFKHEAEDDESYFCTHIPSQCLFIYMCIYKYMYVCIHKLPDLMGQKQCEIPHFQEDQELEEDAKLVAWEEQEEYPFPCPGFWFYSHV